MILKLLVAVFLLMPIIAFGQNNISEIKKIEKRIKSFEEDLSRFERFSDSFLAEIKAKGLPIEDDLLLKLLTFDTSLLDLSFKILITKDVLGSLKGSVSRDSLVELQLDLLSIMKKSPLEFVKDMLPIIKKRINYLKKEEGLIKKWQFQK